MNRLVSVVTALFLAGCYSVRPVPVDPVLGPPDDGEAKKLVSGVKLAVVIPPAPTEQELRRDKGKAPKGTVVDFTSTQGEEYPSRVHMEKSIPLALREAGFDVVPVPTLEAAKATGVPLVMTLLDPQIEGFRRAGGGGLSLEGTIYDVHVHYRARLTTSQGIPLTEVSGHGESSTNFRFEDPYLQTAVVGAVSLATMFVVTSVIALPMAGLLAYAINARAAHDYRPLLGLVNCTDFQGNSVSEKQGPQVCTDAVQLAAVVAIMALAVGVAATSLALSQTVGGWIFGGITGAVKSFASEGIWTEMLKSAHDRAARSFAQGAARAMELQQRATSNGRTP